MNKSIRDEFLHKHFEDDELKAVAKATWDDCPEIKDAEIEKLKEFWVAES